GRPVRLRQLRSWIDSSTSPDSHILPLSACENPARGRLNTSKSGTIVMWATNRLAAGGCDYIHAIAGISGRIPMHGDTRG
ncbi:hypothetical protein ACPXA1_25045, partial [Escherichia coli]|uniref:hypothetical protein n=1 Tax=Escherichia coli TaxID=562 RepID=UPI003CF19CF3